MKYHNNCIRTLSKAMTAALMVGTAFCGSAHAQASSEDSDKALAEIVVTAQKREERLQNVPISVAAVSSETLEKAGVDSTLSLQSVVPGLNIQSSSAGHRPFIRGVGTATSNAGNENSVSTYIDNIYLTSMNSGLLNLTNIKSIEVLKGPQGTLFGRNATGGVIHVHTLDPSHEFGGKVSASFDNYEALTLTGYITGGLGENLAMDVAGYYRKQHEGYGKNIVTGNDVFDDETFTVRSKILWTPSAVDKVTLAADYSQTNGSGIVQRHWPGTASQFGGPVDATHPAPGGSPYVFTGGTWDIASGTDPYVKTRSGGISLAYEHEFDFATLSSFSAYRESRTELAWNFGSAPRDVQFAGWNQPENQFSQELQLSSNPSSPVKWILGAYYLNANVRYDPFFITGLGTAPTQIQFRTKIKFESPAFYGQFTVPVKALGDTNITGGLRYTIDKRSIVGQTEIAFQASPLGPVNDPTKFAAVVGKVDTSKTYKVFTWRLGIDHHFSPDNMIYLTYNRGFKAGTFGSAPANPVATRPEFLDAYEIGLKNTLFGGRATLNVSAFLYKYSDLQVTIFNGTSTQTVNAAKAEIKGVDIDFNAQVTENLRVALGAEFLDHKFTDYPDAPILHIVPLASGGGLTRTVGSAKGNPLAYTSDFVGNIGLFYDLPTTAGDFDANVNLTYNDGYVFEPSAVVRQGSFVDVNASIGLTLKNRTTRISVFGRNIANEAIARVLIPGANPGGYLSTEYRAPRTYGIELSQKF